MPFIASADAPQFELPGVTFAGLAAPSRGANENAAWIVTVQAGTLGTPHRLTREEILVAIEGRALARVGDQVHTLTAGSAVVVPTNMEFELSNPGALPFRAVAILPVGGKAVMLDGTTFTPPWAA
jgi:mannose-6-phosphate isomerase-like protein (cupin superfamily)